MSSPAFFRPHAPLWICALLCSACSSVNTTTYFAAANVDAQDPNVTLYRVRVEADTTNSKSSLLSGFYDTQALRSLYGEVTKPATPAPAGQTVGTYQVVFRNGRWQLVDPAQLYTLVFGPDSKSIAQLIKSYAENSEMGAQFGGLLAAATNPEAVRTAGEIDAQEGALTADRRELAAALTALAEPLDPTATDARTPDSIFGLLVQASQAIANNLGTDTTFNPSTASAGMTDVRTFLTAQRARTP